MKGQCFMKEMLLCRPCAEQLKSEGKVKIVTSVKDKQTCECCGKRRFAYLCYEKEVTGNIEKKGA